MRLSRRRGAALVPWLTVAVAWGLTACAPTPAAERPYGEWPTFLPSPSGPGDQVLDGSAGDPALTVEGDAVLAHVAGGATVRVTVTGPELPTLTAPTPPPTVLCTWTVTMSQATAVLGVDASQFAVRDSQGHVHRPTAQPGQTLPSQVSPGDVASFALQAELPSGEGTVQWAADGANPVATWDFVVEDD